MYDNHSLSPSVHRGIAWIDGDGFVYILDRAKDMINRGGEKITASR